MNPMMVQPGPVRDISLVLTLTHMLLFVALLSALAGLLVVQSTLLDRVAPVLFWLWLVAAPCIGIAALLASRRRSLQGQTLLNGILLGVWATGLVAAFLLH